MRHRFSNSAKVRQEILNRTRLRFESWESIPQAFRIILIEHILDCIQEVVHDL